MQSFALSSAHVLPCSSAEPKSSRLGHALSSRAQPQAQQTCQTGHAHKRSRYTAASAAFRPAVCVTSASESDFEQTVLKEKQKVVLVDFWATWCGPCKLIDPFMKQIEEEFSDKLKVVKVEADPNPTLVEKYKVYGLPTLILFKDGSMIKGSSNEGAITKPQLLKYLEKYGVAKVAK